jgi:hypothetical protein
MISHFQHLERHDGRVSASNSSRVRERPGASHRSRPDRRRRPASAAAPPITHLRDGPGGAAPRGTDAPGAPSGPTGAASRRCVQRPRHGQPPNRRTRSHRPRAGSDGCSSDGRRSRPYGGNRRLTPTDAITAPASSTPRAPVGPFRGLPVGRSAAAVRVALALPGLRGFFCQDAPAFEEVDAPAARGAFASASHNPSSSRGSEAIRSIAREQAPRRLGADSDNAAFERPRQSRPTLATLLR